MRQEAIDVFREVVELNILGSVGDDLLLAIRSWTTTYLIQAPHEPKLCPVILILGADDFAVLPNGRHDCTSRILLNTNDLVERGEDFEALGGMIDMECDSAPYILITSSAALKAVQGSRWRWFCLPLNDVTVWVSRCFAMVKVYSKALDEGGELFLGTIQSDVSALIYQYKSHV